MSQLISMSKAQGKKKCTRCGNQFMAKRTDARFCSANCRQKFTRSQPSTKEQAKKDFPNVLQNPKVHEAIISDAKEKGVKIMPPPKGSKIDIREVVNPEDPRTKQKREPEEGTKAYYLKYGVYYKKDTPK